MGRKYFLTIRVTCDNCGACAFLDDGVARTKEDFEARVKEYYVDADGKDICERCHQKEILN
jgi:hypothetical protein